MKVLMLHNDYRQTGGEYFSVRAEHQSLASRNIDAELVTLANEDVMKAGGSGLFLREMLTSRQSSVLVAEAIERLKPDLVHAQNLFPLFGGGVIDVLKAYALPWVRTLRNYRLRCIAGTCFRDGAECTKCSSASRSLPGVFHSCYRDGTFASAGAQAYARLESRATKRHAPSAYILLSEAMRPLLSQMIGDVPTFIKPNTVGVNAERPVSRMNRDDSFVFVGRFAPEKGIEQVLRQFAESPDLAIALIGGGEYSPEIRRLLDMSTNIRILGELSNSETLAVMRNSIGTIVPSMWAEPFGRVAAESLAVGTPPIVSSNGGLPEIVAGLNHAGLVVHDGGSWTTAARGLKCMAEDAYERLTISATSRWSETYSDTIVGDQLVDIYDRVLRSRDLQ